MLREFININHKLVNSHFTFKFQGVTMGLPGRANVANLLILLGFRNPLILRFPSPASTDKISNQWVPVCDRLFSPYGSVGAYQRAPSTCDCVLGYFMG